MRKLRYHVDHEEKEAAVFLDEGWFWAFWLESFVIWVGSVIPSWRIPLIGKIKVDGDQYTFAEFYGDTLDVLWDEFVMAPIVSWLYAKGYRTFTILNCEYNAEVAEKLGLKKK